MPLLQPEDDTETPDAARRRDPDLDRADEEADTPDEAGPESSDKAAGSALRVALSADELAGLVRRVMDQDQAALAALYDALSGRVYASALRVTRQVALAEEVMQDTFWQVWRQAPRFDAQRGSVQAWVLNMARSRALDAVRGLQRDQLHAQELAQSEIEDDDSDPLDLLDGWQRDARLQRTLGQLDPLKRQLIALAYYRGLTQDEIAQQTGMPLGTVKSHLRRTLAALRAALGADSAERLDAAP